MIFKTLDFHVSTRYGNEPVPLIRPFRLKINYIVDSFSLRIPKKTTTLLFHKLNVCVRYERSQKVPFFALEGFGVVEVVDPNIASIYQAAQAEAAKRVKAFLRRGIRIAAKNDQLFADHLELWEHLLSATEEEFEYDCRLSRFYRSRHWRCEVVLVITPKAYYYDVLIKDSKSLRTIKRHRIKTTECALPFYRGLGFSKLRWDKEDVVGYIKDDKEVFRFYNELPS